MSSVKLHFVDAVHHDFHNILKSRVDSYFSEKNISSKANGFMVFKTVFYLSSLIVSYVLLLFGNLCAPLNFLLFSVIGLFTAFIGVNICHDAIHGAYSKYKFINKLMSVIFNLVGASDYVWNIMHNIIHHTYTNIQGYDDDVETVPILRMTPHQKHKKIMRFQHYYAFFIYGLATFQWVFIKDYKKFFQKKIGNYDNKKHPKKEYFFLFFYKFIYYILFIVLPLIFIGMSWWQIILGFLLLHFVEGITLSLIFSLAHMVDGPGFPIPDENGIVAENWAIHQLKTTSDFCRKNDFVSFLCGGLNFQIEHHLFPKVCHVHYKALSEIVKKTAEEYGIPYLEQMHFFNALKSHVNFLKKLGRPELEFIKA